MQINNHFGLLTPGAIAVNACLDGIEQLLLMQRFGQELDSTRLNGTDRHGDIAMSANEDDWKFNVRLDQRTLKFKSAWTGQSEVENETTGRVSQLAIKEISCRVERIHGVADRPKKVRHPFPHRHVIVDDVNDRLFLSLGRDRWRHARNRPYR
jgi:hypothetical protein